MTDQENQLIEKNLLPWMRGITLVIAALTGHTPHRHDAENVIKLGLETTKSLEPVLPPAPVPAITQDTLAVLKQLLQNPALAALLGSAAPVPASPTNPNTPIPGAVPPPAGALPVVPPAGALPVVPPTPAA